MDVIQKLEEQANLLFGNLSGWEQSTLERIGKRIGKVGKMSLAEVKALNNIATVKQDMDAIVKELAKVTGKNISEVERIYGDVIAEQHLANKNLYDYRGKTFVPFAENKELQSIVKAYSKTTGETMVNLAKTTAQNLGTLDANGKFVPLQKFYTNALDKAVMQVTSGAADFHTAMRETINALGGNGMRVNYGSGVTRRLDTAVRQSLLWGAKQASTEYNEMIGKELGCDGIEIDWHSCPRPSHEFMQGKQFVLGEARTINGELFESADEALERLQDYGCLHFKTPIICGISEPRFSEQQLKDLNAQNAKTYDIDGKEVNGYEASQMMRRLETGIREQKSIKATAQASGDALQVRRCNERIKAYQGKYNEISEITGIAKEPKRMSIGKSQKDLTNASTRGNIVSGATSGGRNPYGKKAEEHAEKYYGLVRSMKTDVAQISKTTGYSEQEIQNVKNFIFYEKHDLGGDEPELFKPDYMMGESWRRLINGNPEPHDLTLINHEIMERELMSRGYSQSEAHIMTSKKYNYDKEATEYYDKIKKFND